MKPRRIQIKNLGAIPSADIDLTGITCAAICGANGLGKSTAFTTAPRFALFGNLKPGTRVDDMVRTGTSEMSVCFDFEHQGGVWRVIRTRSTKGKGKSTLELQRQSGELWASESGASIDETQKKIIDLLNLTDETFVASSMILQGDASNFTARPAGQRKAILGQILQLDQYDGLQDKAKAKVSVTNISLERDKAMVASMDERLAERPQLQADLDAELLNEISIRGNMSESVKVHDAAMNDMLVINSTRLVAAQYKKQSEELYGEVDQKKIALDQQLYRMRVAETFLSEEETIQEKSAEHDRIRDQVTALQVKDDQRVALARDGEQVTRDLEQLESQLKKVIRDVEETEQLLDNRPKMERAKAVYDVAVAENEELDQAAELFSKCYENLGKLDTEIQHKCAMIETKKKADEGIIEVYRKRAAMLAEVGCIDIERATCEFLADAKKAKSKADELDAALNAYLVESQVEIDLLRKSRSQVSDQLEAIDYNTQYHADVFKTIDELAPIVQQLQSLDAVGKMLINLQEQRVDLETRQAASRERRQQLRDDYKKLLAELADLPALSEKLTALAPYLKKRELLPAVREQQKSAKEQIDNLTRDISELEVKRDQAFAEYVSRMEDPEHVNATQQLLDQSRADINTARINLDLCMTKIGALTAKLEALDKDDSARAEIMQRMDPLAKELTRWQTLVKAFGRDGIPALIIENTVPELERIANEILGQMSGGKHNLRFETQRELKSKAGMAETLDIIVGDWAGERIYETFSGGEQLRIDFAIRFALAELLARRAGSRIDFLCIDEGFGSQSEDFLPLVIESVKSIAARFGMVLVISHIKQVQEAFEQQISFRPNGEAIEVKVA